MDEKEKKIIATKGDVLACPNHTLAHTKDLSICMTKSVNELVLYVRSTFDDDEGTKN